MSDASASQRPCRFPGCTYESRSNHLLRLHITAVHTDAAQGHACQEAGCSRSYKTAASLQRHSRTHTRPRREAIECPTCGLEFKRAANYLTHVTPTCRMAPLAQAALAASAAATAARDREAL